MLMELGDRELGDSGTSPVARGKGGREAEASGTECPGWVGPSWSPWGSLLMGGAGVAPLPGLVPTLLYHSPVWWLCQTVPVQ